MSSVPPPAKRGPGRPKLPKTLEREAAEALARASGVVIEKRKRGRPRKDDPTRAVVPTNAAVTQKTASGDEPKRKRGRPPKNRQADPASVTEGKAEPPANLDVQSASSRFPLANPHSSTNAIVTQDAMIQPTSVKNSSPELVDDKNLVSTPPVTHDFTASSASAQKSTNDMPTAHEPSIEQTPVATAATQKVTSEGKPKSKRGRPPKNRQVNQAPVRDEKAQPLTNAEVQSAPTSSPNDDSPNASGAMLLATIQPASVKNDSAVPVDDQKPFSAQRAAHPIAPGPTESPVIASSDAIVAQDPVVEQKLMETGSIVKKTANASLTVVNVKDTANTIESGAVSSSVEVKDSTATQKLLVPVVEQQLPISTQAAALGSTGLLAMAQSNADATHVVQKEIRQAIAVASDSFPEKAIVLPDVDGLGEEADAQESEYVDARGAEEKDDGELGSVGSLADIDDLDVDLFLDCIETLDANQHELANVGKNSTVSGLVSEPSSESVENRSGNAKEVVKGNPAETEATETTEDVKKSPLKKVKAQQQ